MPANCRFLLLILGFVLSGCVAVNPEKPQNEKASDINVELGIGYLQQENFALASEKLQKALKFNPDSPRANYVYAILQERLDQKDLAEYHYERATSLDTKNAEAANNYGAFLCRNEREAESVKYFLRALDNPLYKTPEFAYTNAAVCLIKINEVDEAKGYLKKALAAKSDFATALLVMADVFFKEENYPAAKKYLDRHQLVARPTAKSLWLSIRTALELDANSNVDELSKLLTSEFPDSEEYQAWLKIQ
ncbi:MAG: type IV pilus biogenesis/stability protein PilW [Pseudomonadota bacterium]